MMITCGKCKAKDVPNKGRGLCKKCYLEEYTSNRREGRWRLDKRARTGRFSPPALPLGPTPAGLPGAGEMPAGHGKEVAVTVAFCAEDLGLYERLVKEARFNRRSLAGQLLYSLELDLGANRAARAFDRAAARPERLQDSGHDAPAAATGA
ncbi:MAG: hypothetical protein AB1578_23185 [Thermodesulfobacteriota bacterium]